MAIKNLDRFMGKPIDGALEIALGNMNSPSQASPNPVKDFSPTPSSEISNPEKYIILPGNSHGNYSYNDTLVSIERKHQGKNWPNTHIALAADGNHMLTIRQFVDFLKLLKSGSVYDGKGKRIGDKSALEILKDIIAVRNPYRAEWLDADFKITKKKFIGKEDLIINYGHRLSSAGDIAPQYSEPLEDWLDKDRKPGINFDDWLNNANKHGLPSPNVTSGDLYYFCPNRDNNSVAGFYAGSGRAYLGCYRYPSIAILALGVRVAREKK
ncbi:hypothetical protein HY449_04790 [Candidatus Pacearchaeota archaeon]|nr:hypothetical protein [Candidatus Pacearchaeota archaeon]